MKFGLTGWTPVRTARWDPFDEMRQMQQQLNSMFKDMTMGDRWTEADTLAPLVDVQDRGDKLLVTADLPGVDKQNVNIDVQENLISISAKSGTETESEEEGYMRRERTYKMFSRTLTLPEAVTSEGAKAKLENGVLTVELPKLQIEEKKKILIE
ncbi:molecular chaperone (small heat shock protein) [Methanomethylovorans hollandica DSM 15978]|jgi:HSP20 family protein|uniref:Molecular chaperone (Small heat shock protein) n=1 Tax=Methanomethylovorans hollandica (strain DSM 15978 / NBRC 107637 / DMS1) TaxID=867904 RepID=L0KY31_METHD|nr:Hsp20/alpha crystallin family protein [Methanomethylovorans hollandica]AGB48988.1 molecular chaperone (small heat shock protein) [Methanomethylovorans hollandica DSM 15978]